MSRRRREAPETPDARTQAQVRAIAREQFAQVADYVEVVRVRLLGTRGGGPWEAEPPGVALVYHDYAVDRAGRVACAQGGPT